MANNSDAFYSFKSYLQYLRNNLTFVFHNQKRIFIMNEVTECAICKSENIYFDGTLYICPDCGSESTGNEQETSNDTPKDSNGTELVDGDSVTVIKDLKVRGSSMVIKRGTKVKSIRLTENPEEVDCKIDGSSIVLKTCFLKK